MPILRTVAAAAVLAVLGGSPAPAHSESETPATRTQGRDLLAKQDFAGAEAEAVDTADPAAFQSTITGLVSTFQSETETVGNSFSELDAKYPDPGLNEAVDILQGVEGITMLRFTDSDVVRHPMVGRIVRAYEARAKNTERG